MSFLHNLYLPHSIEESPAGITATGRLDARHDVFRAHFPAQPVLPGVVMLQLVEELWRETSPAAASLRLERVINAKFTAPVMPDRSEALSFTLTPVSMEGEEVKLKAEVKTDEGRCALFTLLFSPAPHEQ